MDWMLWVVPALLLLVLLTIGIANRFETPEDPED